MAVITLTINDELVSGRTGQSILEVCREQKINIPTLCHVEGLSERGGCRLCLVAVEGFPRLLPACTTEATEGMVIVTHNEKIDRYRKMILELTLSERNHTCAVCVSNGNCELQTLAAELGVDHVRYSYLDPDMKLDTSHDKFGIDHNRCILCLRCVRVCDEVEGAHIWDVKNRGIDSQVIIDLDSKWQDSKGCTECGKCVEVCPTGALFYKGMTVAEMEKETGFLTRIINGRENHRWSR
jgi:bidirectional [NiFe] hydrogenase diaphorase subunit